MMDIASADVTSPGPKHKPRHVPKPHLYRNDFDALKSLISMIL